MPFTCTECDCGDKFPEYRDKCENSDRPLTELERSIRDEINLFDLFKDIGGNTKSMDDEYLAIVKNPFSGSRITELLRKMISFKLNSEELKIAKAILKINNIKLKNYNDLNDIRELIVDDVDPEIYELITNDLNNVKLGKYFVSKISKQGLNWNELNNFSTTLENDPNKEEADKVQIPICCISKIEHMMVSLIATMISEVCKKVVTAYIDNDKEIEIIKEEQRKLIKSYHERNKWLKAAVNKAKVLKDYDVLTQMDDVMFAKFDKEGKAEVVPYASYRKCSIIICKYVSRSKKKEIIKNKK